MIGISRNGSFERDKGVGRIGVIFESMFWNLFIVEREKWGCRRGRVNWRWCGKGFMVMDSNFREF